MTETKTETRCYMVVTSKTLGLLVDAEVKAESTFADLARAARTYNESHTDDDCEMYFRIETVTTETQEYHF